jgi:hypothetical protein
MAMTAQAMERREERFALAALGAATWLRLAAAPTFAIMALLTAIGPQDLLCSAAHGASVFGGMIPMYLLMSAFHVRPWIQLIAGGPEE